jgi:hypothetical protein
VTDSEASAERAVALLAELGVARRPATSERTIGGLQFEGPWPVVAWVFARAGACAVVTPREDFVTVTPLPVGSQNDLARIAAAFGDLRRLGYLAEGALAFTSTEGWDRVRAEAGPSAKAVFWNWQAHGDAFDEEGNLIDDLHLQWAGDIDEIATTLSRNGLMVEPPRSSKETFVVRCALSSHDGELLRLRDVASLLGSAWQMHEIGGQQYLKAVVDGRTHLVSVDEADVVVVLDADDGATTLYITPGDRLEPAVEVITSAVGEGAAEALEQRLRDAGFEVVVRR